jgi:hypothetical protein
MPEFWSFLGKYCKQNIPDQSTLRKHNLPIYYEESLESIRDNIEDAFIWAYNGFCGSLYREPCAGKLDIEVLSNPSLICFKALHHTNHPTFAKFVNDGLKALCPTRVHEE